MNNDTTLDGIARILSGLLEPGAEFILITVDRQERFSYTASTPRPLAMKALKNISHKLKVLEEAGV